MPICNLLCTLSYMKTITDSTNPPSKPKQRLRWYQFSLRTLFIGFTLCALVMGLIRYAYDSNKMYECASYLVYDPEFAGLVFWQTQSYGDSMIPVIQR
jgi:hypothetical protein